MGELRSAEFSATSPFSVKSAGILRFTSRALRAVVRFPHTYSEFAYSLMS
jgi:hypothetical protein